MIWFKYKKTFNLPLVLVASFAMAIIALAITPNKVFAAIEESCPDGYTVRFTPGQGESFSELCANHQTGGPTSDDVEAQQAAADPSRGANLNADCDDTGNCCEGETLTKDNCVIIGYILTITNVLSGLVGLVVVIMLAYGGMQYATARDDPSQISAAKERIRNAVLALVFYLFAVSFLQYLIPGGIF